MSYPEIPITQTDLLPSFIVAFAAISIKYYWYITEHVKGKDILIEQDFSFGNLIVLIIMINVKAKIVLLSQPITIKSIKMCSFKFTCILINFYFFYFLTFSHIYLGLKW